MSAPPRLPHFDELHLNDPLMLQAQRLGRIGYVISDARTGRVYWSETLFEYRRVSRREYFTRPEALEYIHPEDRPRYLALLDAAIRDRDSFTIEMRVVNEQGEVFFEEVVAQPQFDDAGNYTGVVGFVRDITDRKRGEIALRQQEETLRALFNGIGDAILFMRDKHIVDCNSAALDVFRCSRDQLVSKTPVDLSPEFQAGGQRSADLVERAVEPTKQGQRQFFEWRYARFDGTEFLAEVTVSAIVLDGEPYAFAVIRDISERKAAEAELRLAYDRFARIFDLSPVGLVIGDVGENPGSGTVLDLNEAALKLFRVTRAQVVGRTIQDLGLGANLEQVSEIRRQLDRYGVIRDLPLRLTRSDGREIQVDFSATMFELEHRRLTILMFRDVTQQRESERRVRELNDVLGARVRQLRAIADNLPVLICYQDSGGRIRFLNETAQSWLAVRETDALGKSAPEVLPKEYIEATRDLRRLRDDGRNRIETTVRFPDGKTRSTESIYVPDIDEHGVLQGFYSLAIDITDRKTAETALQGAYDKFASVFAVSPDAMIITMRGPDVGQGIIVDVNPAAQVLFGYDREELIGQPFTILGFDTDSLRAGRESLVRQGGIRDMQTTCRGKDGHLIHAEVNGSAFVLDGTYHSLVIVHDIGGRLAAEARIHELNETRDASLKLLRDIADNLPVTITYQDREGRVRFANKTAQEWLGKSEAELLGRTIPETMPQDYVDQVRPLRERMMRAEQNSSVGLRAETTLRWPDGVVRTIDVTNVYDRDADGKMVGHYALAVDISERRATEDQLRQAQKMEAVGKLTGGVAHDFNNLLAVILGNLELAQDHLKGRDEAIRRLLAPALRAAERGATLTRSLLAFARQQALSPSVLVVSGLLRDMTDLLRRTVPANIEIEFVGGAGLWKCEVDPGQLQNAVLNLVVNARDAMPDGGKVTIETGNVRFTDDYARSHSDVVPGQYVMVAVSDTGTGMDPEVAARAFEPFFTTKGPGEGTGLGLSMVYGFAKQSRGHVTIYSEVGHGTTVRLYLPRWHGAEEETATRKPTALRAAGNEIILVVEDDDDVRFVTVTMLTSLGYTVLEAISGRAALDMLRDRSDIALLVTDVVLSGDMNGRRVADAARERNPSLKVLFMSGYTENAIVHHGRLDPGVNFIQKPFGRQDLAAKVREVLDAAGDGS